MSPSDDKILNDAFVENALLKKNVKDLEVQLHTAYSRIIELNQEILNIKSKDDDEGTVV